MTYYLDKTFFRRQGLHLDPALLDIVSKLNIRPAAARRGLKLCEYLINLGSLITRLAFTRPDVVHVQFLPTLKSKLPLEAYFMRAIRRLGIKIVYTVHNVLPQDTGEKHLRLFRRIYRLADRLICHDECARDRLVREFGIDFERISIIPHGPLLNADHTTSREDARKKLGIEADRCFVLWHGILRPYKGVSFLLQSWKRIQPSRACLAIVGNGDPDLVREICKETDSLEIRDSVRLDFRFVSVAELDDYLSAADVLVYPYREITTSGALMTGLGRGKAIIATQQPAFRRVLKDGENALVVDYGDVDGLAARLKQLINNPSQIRKLGEQAAKSYADGPQWPSIAEKTLACYRAAVEGRA